MDDNKRIVRTANPVKPAVTVIIYCRVLALIQREDYAFSGQQAACLPALSWPLHGVASCRGVVAILISSQIIISLLYYFSEIFF